MDPKPSGAVVLLAPASSGGALRLPARQAPPSVEDRLVESETREQIVRGRRVVAMPANPPHGDRHFKLDYIIGAHVNEGYIGSTDLLTRASATSDFATDTCVRRAGIDPATGARYLEELAFEVVNEQSLRDITEQAEDLTTRGVRRVIAIFVKKSEVREWSPAKSAWLTLDPDATLTDPTLARPLRVRALLDAAEADNAVASALLAKNVPVLVKSHAKERAEGRAEGKAEGNAEGKAEGLREGVRSMCRLLGIALTVEREAALEQMNAGDLDALRARLERDRRWD